MNWSRLITFCALLLAGVGSGLAVASWVPPSSGVNFDSIRILVIVFSVFSGVLIALVTVLGDPDRLFPGSWRVASAHTRIIQTQMNWLRVFFYAYLLVIIAVFAVTFFIDAGIFPDHVLWLKRVALGAGAAVLVWSLILPGAVIKAHSAKLYREIQERKTRDQEAHLSASRTSE